MNKGISKLQLDGKTVKNATEIAEQFNLYFSSIADNLRSELGNTPSDLSKLVNFVESCKDPDVVLCSSNNNNMSLFVPKKYNEINKYQEEKIT